MVAKISPVHIAHSYEFSGHTIQQRQGTLAHDQGTRLSLEYLVTLRGRAEHKRLCITRNASVNKNRGLVRSGEKKNVLQRFL